MRLDESLHSIKPQIKLNTMQSNTTTAESPKLKITATYTETKRVEKEISFPYFFKDEYGNHCKLINEHFYLSTKSDVKFGLHTIEAYPVKHFKDRVVKGTQITEEEFEVAYDKAMMYINLIKENKEPSIEEDENVQIDEMIYGGRL